MQFGFTLKGDFTIERTLALTRQAEAAGFDYGWVFDTHVLFREPYVQLALMAQATTTLRLGTCVTNPATREPSVTASALAVLNEVSGGRMDLGIGRGDSARRVLGKSPTTMADLEEAIVAIKGLVEGRAVAYEGRELRLTLVFHQPSRVLRVATSIRASIRAESWSVSISSKMDSSSGEPPTGSVPARTPLNTREPTI